MNLGSESEQVEFKRSTSEMREGMESIASILNKHTKGVLYFGVRNDGEVVGQEANESTLRKVSQAIGYAIEPRVYPEISLETTEDGKVFVKVEFEGYESPYACNGRYRIRIADEDVIMSRAKLQELMGDNINRHDPWDRRASARQPEDVDEKQLIAFVERGRARNRIGFAYEGVMQTLSSLGLLTRDGELTNAADVLFCNQQRVGLKMGLLANHERSEVLDIHQEMGTVFELADRAVFYILNNTRRRLVITGQRTRDEVPEIPREALREAMMNAFGHCAWYEHGYVQVEIYYDTVEISNPGWFINGQDPIEHLEGRSTSSRTRNELLTNTLFRSGDIESYGMGIRSIRRLCDEAGVRVEYRNEDIGTKLVFYRNDAFLNGPATVHVGEGVGENAANVGESVGENAANVGEDVGESASDSASCQISMLLRETPTLSAKALAERLGLSDRHVERLLAELKRSGAIERVGPNRGGYWRVLG